MSEKSRLLKTILEILYKVNLIQKTILVLLHKKEGLPYYPVWSKLTLQLR